MFTTNPKTITFTANYEGDPNNADDEPLFEDVQVAAIKDFNRTSGDPNYTNAQVLRSSPNSQIGSAIAIPVGQGDKITAIAFAKYIAAAQDPNVSSVTIASALVSAFTGVASSGIEGGTGTINNNFGSGSLIGGTGFPLESGTAPKAFLNLMFLPEDDPINLVKDASFAYDQVADGATEAVIDGVSTSPFDELRIDDFVAPGQGYVMVYVSNEGSLTDVYFDDIEITVEEHPVIQKDDYMPFGLTFNSYQRVTAKKNDFLYNDGAERVDDLDLNVDMTYFRVYDPALGRWWQQDPKADQLSEWSPYNYSFNNPVRYNDPLGDCPPGTICNPVGMYYAAKNYLKRWFGAATNLANGTSGSNLPGASRQTQRIHSTMSTLNDARTVAQGVIDGPGQVMSFTSANDVSVLTGGANLDGSSAGAADYVFAGVGLFLPVSGNVPKRLAGKGLDVLSGFVKKFKNQSEHLTDLDVTGAIRDILGDPVLRPDGTAFDHLGEVEDALSGVGNQLNKLNKAIDSGDLTGEVLDEAQRLRSSVQKEKDRIQNLLNKARSSTEE